MSFFNLSDNSNAADTGSSFEMGGGDLPPIPNNTDVLAAPDDAKWDKTIDGEQYISLRWTVLAPKEYANRKIFQKVRVLNADEKKADKAKRMLAAIDANAGGKLTADGGRPTDQSLVVALVNKPMVLKLMVWEMLKDDGTTGTGNWVAAVSPRKQGGAQTAPAAAEQPPAPQPAGAGSVVDDDIPW